MASSALVFLSPSPAERVLDCTDAEAGLQVWHHRKLGKRGSGKCITSEVAE